LLHSQKEFYSHCQQSFAFSHWLYGAWRYRAAKTETEAHQQQPNKALHPTAYSPLVPRSLSAAGELGRYAFRN